jgi:hypothetical protein
MVIGGKCAGFLALTFALLLFFVSCGGNSQPATSGGPSVPIYAVEAPAANDGVHFKNFTANVLSHIAGPGVYLDWAMIDDCNPTAPCPSESQFNWSDVDADLMAYINNPNTDFKSGCNGKPCKIVLVMQSTSDSGNINNQTPPYVFSPAYAASLGAAPQDVSICNTVQGGTVNGIAPPITSPSGSFSNDYAVWNANGGAILAGTDLAMTGTFPTTNFSGFPVVYEKPFLSAWENFIHNFLIHFSTNGSGSGPTIAPYIAYIRFGFALGAENYPECALDGPIPYPDWKPSISFPAGYVAQPTAGNPGNYTFVSNGSGASGASAPSWCQSPYCNTSADGSISGWRNTGNVPGASSTADAIWPGPEGMNVEPTGFTTNGYLSTWGDADGTGYVASLAQFIASQKSSIPIVASTHNGVPFNSNWNFADSEAITAVGDGIGIGMEALSIADPLTFAAGHAPTTHDDWVENFNVFAAAPIVRFLQAAWPGGGIAGVQAEQFPISSISVAGGTATLTCSEDCTAICGGLIYISGSANAALSTTWPVNLASCGSGTITFPTNVPAGTYAGGSVFADDYLPIIIPFARQHNATAIELHECTLDYAYGTQTTAIPCEGSPGPDTSYQGAIAQ